MPRRLLTLLRSRAVGAMAAQIWQAVASFGIQIAAAWILGAAGLGQLSLCLGVIVLAAAVASGMIGDSMTVLDRHDDRVRSGLIGWTLVFVLVGFAGSVSIALLSGVFDLTSALLFGAALAAYGVEELVRRMFMTELRFWWLLLVDSTALVTAAGVIVVWWAVAPIGLPTFLAALAAGQTLAVVVGLLLTAKPDRRLVRPSLAGLATVARFGVWRGVQVAANPAVMSGVRLIVTLAVGTAALGQVEGARIFAAPVTLCVQGIGSYLMASYARDKTRSLTSVYARAKRTSLVIVAVAAGGGALLTLLVPVLAPLVLGPRVMVQEVAVIGWITYAIGLATYQPFASLAAVRGRPASVLLCRLTDVGVTLAVLAAVMLPTDLPATVAPFVMTSGLLLGGTLVRWLVLRPLLRAEISVRDDRATDGTTSTTASTTASTTV